METTECIISVADMQPYLLNPFPSGEAQVVQVFLSAPQQELDNPA